MEERIEAAGWKTANCLYDRQGDSHHCSRWFGSPDDETRFGEVWMTRVGIGFVVVAIAGIPLLGDTANFTLLFA